MVAGEHLEGGGLAGAVDAQKAEAFAAAEGEAQAPHRVHCAVEAARAAARATGQRHGAHRTRLVHFAEIHETPDLRG